MSAEKYVNLSTILQVRYFKKYTTERPLMENVNIIKNRLQSNDTNDIISVIENWRALSNNPNVAIYKILERVNNIESDDNRVVYSLDKNIFPLLTEECVNNIINKLSSSSETNCAILECLYKYELQNRLDSNYNKINNKLNLSSTIRNSKFNAGIDKHEVLYNICESIDKAYTNIDVLYRYNIVLESILYGFGINGIKVDDALVLETVTEYYSNLLDKEKMINVVREINLFSEESKEKTLKTLNTDSNSNKPYSIPELCKVFKSNPKSVDGLKSTMNKIYARSIDDCVAESDNVLGIITSTLITLGATCINPILGILAAFTQYMITREINLTQTEEYLSNLKDEKRKIKKKLDKEDSDELNKYLDALDDAIDKVESYRSDLQTDEENNDDLDSYDESCNTSMQLAYLLSFSEAVDNNNLTAINVLNESLLDENGNIDYTILQEGNIMNTLKLAKEKIKHSMEKLSGKEKALCSQIDSRFDLFVRNMERALSMEKREKVIKGKVAPSLTNMVKLAIAGTAGFLISPAITAITMLAGYALSKKATIKEKQYILDELDVQLKICERKINQAEMKGDDKALEELYRLQARLSNESKRIKYNIRLYHESGCVL